MALSAGAIAGITAGAQALGGLFGAGQSKKNTKRTIKAQKEMQEYEWQQNLDLYHYNNAYNTPEAQMQRLKEAGLNPNLVYGNGSVSGNTSGQLPHYDASQPDYRGQQSQTGEFLNAISTFLDYQTKSAQIDNLQAQNDMIHEQTAGVSIENAAKELNLGLSRQSKDSRLKALLYEGPLAETQYDTALQNQFTREAEARIAQETLPEAIEMVKTELQNAKRRGQNLDQDLLLRVQQTLAQKLENQYRELGVSNSDHLAFRIIARVIRSLFPNFKF